MKLTILSTFLRRYKIVIPEFYLKEELIRIISEAKSERIIEYPLVLSSLPEGKQKILDVGCRYSLFPIQLASMGYRVYGIDIHNYKRKHPNFEFIKGDIIDYPLKENFFDVVCAISTIEHVGLPMSYKDSKDNRLGDIIAVKNIFRSIKVGGMFLLTIPYGKPCATSWYRIYGKESLKDLLAGFKIKKIMYFARDEHGNWLKTKQKIIENIDNTKETNGIAFVTAVKNTY